MEYNPEENILWIANDRYKPETCEIGDIGNCIRCGNELETLSFHEVTPFNAIAARCTSCNRLLLSIYDSDWSWYKEVDLSRTTKVVDQDQKPTDLDELSGLQLLEAIPENALKTIFSPREVEAMFSRARGEKYVRQYLYNARKKYSRFADVFGILIDV
ncbi:hypothetical protein J2755_000495 [Methanohalophilus levihalophilus]|uniref:hypothetical protein n=1 Tax=Methanohalophilus levihalophilus TaxID=1431282 RepID=UPI001AE9D0EE|nr:hypothetical protein [Methanohalophilus levihalophilus]MBP2029575.1 hypothetical protein [Methanohalophilus levihalophilus]